MTTAIARSSTHLRDAARDAAQNWCSAGYALARVLRAVLADQAWQEWGHVTPRAYLVDELGFERTWATRILSHAEKIPQSLADACEERGVPYSTAIEAQALLLADGDAAVDVIAGRTEHEVRQLARAKRGEPQDSGEWFTVHWSFPVELRPLFDRVMNRARFALNRPMPSDVAVVEWIVAQVDELRIDPATVMKPHELAAWEQSVRDGGPHDLADLYRQRVRDIDDGKARCALVGTRMAAKDCAGWDASSLDPHHVRPKSKQGHDGPIVTLCRWCHELHQPKWRRLAKFLGYDEIAEVK
jgi:hypothetical protein